VSDGCRDRRRAERWRAPGRATREGGAKAVGDTPQIMSWSQMLGTNKERVNETERQRERRRLCVNQLAYKDD